jgi:hypothetical protein
MNRKNCLRLLPRAPLDLSGLDGEKELVSPEILETIGC